MDTLNNLLCNCVSCKYWISMWKMCFVWEFVFKRPHCPVPQSILFYCLASTQYLIYQSWCTTQETNTWDVGKTTCADCHEQKLMDHTKANLLWRKHWNLVTDTDTREQRLKSNRWPIYLLIMWHQANNLWCVALIWWVHYTWKSDKVVLNVMSAFLLCALLRL